VFLFEFLFPTATTNANALDQLLALSMREQELIAELKTKENLILELEETLKKTKGKLLKRRNEKEQVCVCHFVVIVICGLQFKYEILSEN
jgi:hypothetical protein